VELGEAFERLSAARARRWPWERGQPADPAPLEAPVAREEPVIRELRDVISSGLTGLRPRQPLSRPTLLAQIAVAEPAVEGGSSEGQIKPQQHLAPNFFVKYQPPARGRVEAELAIALKLGRPVFGFVLPGAGFPRRESLPPRVRRASDLHMVAVGGGADECAEAVVVELGRRPAA
jgi:hypothetical protein